MKAILCLPLLLCSYASAEEAGDRAAIGRAIATLNEQPQRTTVFTADASSELDRLPDVKLKSVRPLGVPDAIVPVGGPLGATVTISHEPFGEATINLPGATSLPAMEVLNPRIASGSVRFLTPDVALAEGAWTYTSQGATQTIPLLFVMKKEGDAWKIASLRLLASGLTSEPHGSTAAVAAP
jgi:hypothetical protein